MQGEFNFAKAFGGQDNPSSQRLDGGLNLLRDLTKNNNFRERDMFHILRDKESGICCSIDAHHPTQGSQVAFVFVETLIDWFKQSGATFLGFDTDVYETKCSLVHGYTRHFQIDFQAVHIHS